MAGIHHPTRGGTRGGGDQFDWDDVKVDKYRENYLGHSLKAPVGRWQKGKDLTWYTKQSKMAGKQEKLKAEVAAIKRAEEEAMAAALGLKPSSQAKPQQALTKQEIAEVCRRKSVEEMDESDERIKGIGFQSRRSQILYSGGDSTTTKDGATVFEHDQSQCKSDDRLKMSEDKKRAAPPTTPTTPTSKAVPEVATQRDPGETKEEEKETAPATKKKKHKKEKKKKAKKVKKSKEKRHHDSESSESDEEEWIERQVPVATSKSHRGNGHSQPSKRRRHDSLHSEEEWAEKKQPSHRKRGHHEDKRQQERYSGRKRSPIGETHRKLVERKRRREQESSDNSDDEYKRRTKKRERSRERDREEGNHRRQKRQRHDTYTDSD